MIYETNLTKHRKWWQLVEAPCPQNKKGQLLISTTKSLISVGTEKMLIDFGKSGWVNKARSQPEKVKMVL